VILEILSVLHIYKSFYDSFIDDYVNLIFSKQWFF